MKSTPILFALGLAAAFTGAVLFSAQVPAPAAPSGVAPGSHERVNLKVLKVYAATDGEAIFRAYVVEWKGQEVVVTDTLAKTNHRVGDSISVLVMNQPFPQGRENYRLLHFSAMPTAR